MRERMAEQAPLCGRRMAVRGDDAGLLHARALLAALGAEVVDDIDNDVSGAILADDSTARVPTVRPATVPAPIEWAGSGAMALTGHRGGAPLLAPGAPASAVRGALLVFDLLSQLAHRPPGALPDARMLGERAALTGARRNAPWSVGGAFRCLRAADGWLGISLPRDDDHALVPALVDDRAVTESWAAVAAWAAGTAVAGAVDRAQTLGIAAAAVPADRDERAAAPLATHVGGRRRRTNRAVVVDLSALWAGPLCASLLHAAGARVIKVESVNRSDGARRGNQTFFDLLNHGHESVVIDLGTANGRAALARLLCAADLVIESARPRALRQLGIDADDFVTHGTSWVSITGYGRREASAHRVAFGDDAAAAAGLVGWTREGPVPCGDAIADPLAGVHAAAAAAAVLLDDHAHLVDLSMRDVAASAAALPSEPAEVLAQGSGWVVRTECTTAVVAAPCARAPTGPARPPGADTASVLDWLGC
ncbi:MAG: CoA transferase [Actinomycetes bacterium]